MDGADHGALARRRLPVPDDVVVARQVARVYLERFGLGAERADQAELVVSELVTNALRHGAAPVELRVWPCPLRCVVVEVRDAKDCPLPLPSPVAPWDLTPWTESGRGLALVTELSGGYCGTVPLAAAGKSVWAALAADSPLVCPRALTAFVDSRVRSDLPGLP